MDNIKIRNHLDALLASQAFQRAERQTRFLRYVVEKSIEGKTEDLKEYNIALDVFDRDSSYDPKQDSTVRVEASKLRARLERYYQATPEGDGIRIEIPKGGYVARFIEQPTTPIAPVTPPAGSEGLSRRWVVAGGIAATAVAAATAFLGGRSRSQAASVILVAGETAGRGGYTEDAAQTMQALANHLGLLKIRVIQAKDLNHLAAQSKDASYCVSVMAGRCWENPGRVRLIAELREVNHDFRLWSGHWDEVQTQVDALARKGADAIASQMARIQTHPPPSRARLNALEPYREALHTVRPRKDFVFQTTEEKGLRTRLEDLMRSARLLEEAAKIDPTFTEAHAQLAWMYQLSIPYDRRMVEQAARTARRALDVDPNSVEGNYVNGYVSLLEKWDIAGAEAAMLRCVERSAFHVEAYRFYLDAATIRGHAKDALNVLARPLSVMPRSKVLRFAATTTMLQAGFAHEAEQLAREALRWEPGWLLAHWQLGRALEAAGRMPDAEIEFRNIQRADPKSQRFAAALAHLLASGSDPQNHREAMALLLNIGMDKTAPALVGLVEARCGDPAKALNWMERAEREHDHNLPYAVIDPHFQSLRNSELGRRLHQRFAGT
jgi:tetratricopeptide (TPR) repeat protein